MEITVTEPYKVLQVKTTSETGEVHRYTVAPNITAKQKNALPIEVQEAITKEHTTEVKSAYKATLPKSKKVSEVDAIVAKRIKEYGSIGEQLDMIYHKGLDSWKNHVTAVKLNNPKPD